MNFELPCSRNVFSKFVWVQLDGSSYIVQSKFYSVGIDKFKFSCIFLNQTSTFDTSITCYKWSRKVAENNFMCILGTFKLWYVI